MAFRAPARLRLPLVPRGHHRGLASNSSSDGKHVAVIGGGLTGLATAYFLAKRLPASARIDLYEASDRLGGWIRTDRVRVDVGGVRGVVPFERGPRTLSTLRGNTWRYDDLVLYELILDLGLQPSYPKDLPRYLCYPNHLVTMPPDASILDYLREPLFRECARGALATAVGYLTGRHRRDGLPAADLSVADWLRLITGDGAVGANLASAMIHGIYGGDIERLSVRTVLDRALFSLHGPRLEPGRRRVPERELAFMRRVMRDDEHGLVCALANRPKGALVHFGARGMEALPRALEEALKGQPNVTIHRQTPATNLHYDRKRDRIKVTATKSPRLYDHVVSTTSSDVLVPSAGIPSVSIMTVNLWYPIENLKPPGFGYLIPQATSDVGQNPERALGVFFDSDVIAERAPDEPPGTKLFVLMGGHHYRGHAPPDEEEAVALAKGLLERQLGIPRDAPCHAMARLARDCIPQHEVGHGERLQYVHKQIMSGSGGRLSVANGSYGRIGAMGALRNAYDAAHAIVEGRLSSGLEDFIDDRIIEDVSLADIPCRQPQSKA
ncbi:protoporphyrinogen oxidase [Cordyceps fumosorosea ARSEF 2679]|uniref:Protoporphyrinogen oxidase n=1 Tax=Cordyceps fumosorosea (strain ARSEF 2679) TaxID=1081104 RepID=A0A162MM03_CORFA|nr:protoporphyrinogen oxidase [Cordyceps fumosorosea ARSEF 2679]OAA63960.1 protoporphyrinogen oxidase [Cordyceps fumosorosea ARSEF 2679]